MRWGAAVVPVRRDHDWRRVVWRRRAAAGAARAAQGGESGLVGQRQRQRQRVPRHLQSGNCQLLDVVGTYCACV